MQDYFGQFVRDSYHFCYQNQIRNFIKSSFDVDDTKNFFSYRPYLRSFCASILDVFVHIAQNNWSNVGFKLEHSGTVLFSSIFPRPNQNFSSSHHQNDVSLIDSAVFLFLKICQRNIWTDMQSRNLPLLRALCAAKLF